MGRLSQAALPPVELDPLDPDAVMPITFDWLPWLDDAGIASITSARWIASGGIQIGDGVTAVTKRGVLSIPPAPTIVGGDVTAHVWVDTAEVGSVVRLTNHIQAGSTLTERSAVMQVREL